MHFSKWSTAGNTSRLTKWICCEAILAHETVQPIGKRGRGAGCAASLFDHLPDSIIDLQAFDILRNIVQAPQQAERIPQSRERAHAETGGNSEPGLLSKFHHDPIFDGLDRNGERCLSAGGCTRMSSNLDDHPFAIAQGLCVQVAPVEFSQ